MKRKRTSPTPDTERTSAWHLAAAGAVALVWAVLVTAISSRIHLVMGYTAIANAPPSLEPFLATHAAWALAFSLAAIWFWLFLKARDRNPTSGNVRALNIAVAAAGLSLVPILPALFRVSESGSAVGGWGPFFWEPLWLAACSGVSFSKLVGVLASDMPRSSEHRNVRESAVHWCNPTSYLTTVVLSGIAALWWYSQTCFYYDNYLLGFNDFGHFAQRIANTVNGRGFLLETPVLPAFWDHFNPGLLCVVPLWTAMPSVHTVFILQALCLAGSAVLINALARQLGYPRLAATLFACAWLVQPAVGQMNLAYTYGWHPISLAIPLLLAALLALEKQRINWAMAAAGLAMTMEEGVIVVVCLFCATKVAHYFLQSRGFVQISPSQGSRSTPELGHRHVIAWAIAAVGCALAFLLVYRFSGLADFQTGRFVALGDNAFQVVLSPLLRPEAFWGQLFRWDKALFLLCLWLPCYLPSLIRGWPWMLPTALPLSVLIVWDHKPAASLAFQYSSALLPLFWLSALRGASVGPNAHAAGAFLTGLVLSLYVGQLPYSSPTLLDVVGQTYGSVTDERRQATEADGQWLDEQIAKIRNQGGDVLATGRIAAHLVGDRDIETVGQYLQRRTQLAQLPDRQKQPLGHYRWLILDRRESFQQSTNDTAQVAAEARSVGFEVVAEAYDLVVFKNPNQPPTASAKTLEFRPAQ